MKRKVYEWKSGARQKGNAQKVGQELARIERKQKRFVPGEVVDFARDESTALHECFEWDDTVAGELFRVEQAKSIIRHIVVVPGEDDEAETKPRRLFVSIKDGKKDHYMDTEKAMSDEDLRRQVLTAAWKELLALYNKYKDLQELAVVWEALDQARDSAVDDVVKSG